MKEIPICPTSPLPLLSSLQYFQFRIPHRESENVSPLRMHFLNSIPSCKYNAGYKPLQIQINTYYPIINLSGLFVQRFPAKCFHFVSEWLVLWPSAGQLAGYFSCREERTQSDRKLPCCTLHTYAYIYIYIYITLHTYSYMYIIYIYIYVYNTIVYARVCIYCVHIYGVSDFLYSVHHIYAYIIYMTYYLVVCVW